MRVGVLGCAIVVLAAVPGGGVNIASAGLCGGSVRCQRGDAAALELGGRRKVTVSDVTVTLATGSPVRLVGVSSASTAHYIDNFRVRR